MRAPIFLLFPLMASLSLASCAGKPPPSAPVAAVRVGADVAAAQRRAEIRRQMAPACPRVMTADELDALAAFVEKHAAEPDVVASVAARVRANNEARACRGLP